jgi:hypothetical protein
MDMKTGEVEKWNNVDYKVIVITNVQIIWTINRRGYNA